MEYDKCCSPIDARSESFVVCEGDCSKSYHTRCVGLSESHAELLATKNILWMCDSCLDQFYRQRSASSLDKPQHDSSTRIESELVIIKSRIDFIVNTLSNVTSQAMSDVTVASPLPLSSTKLQNDSDPENELDRNHVNSCYSLTSSTQRKDSFSLFLTNINSLTTEREIECMVRKSMKVENSEEINVYKLVPKWKDLCQIDYASFKVVMNNSWKTKALDRSTWPPGIKFREFVSVCRNIWSPNAEI